MVELDCKTFAKLARPGAVVPVTRRITADLLTPVSAYLRLARRSKFSFLLESVEGGERIARYSFIGVDPYLRLRSRGGLIELVDTHRETIERRSGNLFEELRRLTRAYRPVSIPGLPPFTSGAVGYLAYDVVRLLERLPERAADDLHLPDAEFLFFSQLVAFDHIRHQILLIANVFCDRQRMLRRQYGRAVAELDVLEAALGAEPQLRTAPAGRRGAPPKVKSNFARRDYLTAVQRAKRHIRAGDIYQVVLSQRFQTPIRTDPFSIYRALRIVNPSPYMYFLNLGELQVVGSSPEMLVKVQGRDAFYRPIAGTRPRGATEEEDRRLEHQLRSSVKERAEHIMLVDLGRNDLGRVSEYGSVKVEELMTVERYSHVMHLVSSLRGRLRRGVDCFDALAACFPAGTVTGAPKVRAMQIIDEIEPTRRGLYAGCVCYLDFSGNLDSCIAIRTMVIRDGVAYVQAGGGIVADSRPEREFQETENKARALLAAIELAEEGLV
ncbi:MAG TPA: anthranilate synthase component I [Candidatus Xenobia bacterium]|nr:anthranilate synthase component I [Candidatus Xenobia bacterium]